MAYPQDPFDTIEHRLEGKEQLRQDRLSLCELVDPIEDCAADSKDDDSSSSSCYSDSSFEFDDNSEGDGDSDSGGSDLTLASEGDIDDVDMADDDAGSDADGLETMDVEIDEEEDVQMETPTNGSGANTNHKGSAEKEAKGAKKFQREIWQLRLLPYYEELQKDADRHFSHIKTGLAHSVLRRDARPGLIYWVHELDRFLQLYSRRFTKRDHVALVRLLHSALTMKGLDFRVVKVVANTLSSLLSRRNLLSRDDLELDWRPLYELYVEIAYKHLEEDGVLLLPENLKKTLGNTILECNLYFPASATQEILDEVRPFVCPWDDSMMRALSVLNLFLPTTLSKQQHDEFGARLWFDEVWHWFTSPDFSSMFEDKLLSLFARLAKDCPGYVDWSERYDPIFNRLIRAFKLEVGSDRVRLESVSRVFGSLGFLVAYTLGGADGGVQPHLSQLFNSLQNYFHPSNYGSHTSNLLTFILKLVTNVMHRVSRERYHPNRQPIKVPPEMCLTDEQIDAFVLSFLPCLKFAAFSKVKQELVPSIMRILAFLSPGIIIPQVLDLVYPALETLTEPHRLIQSLNILACVCIPLVRDDPKRAPNAKRLPLRSMDVDAEAHLQSFRGHALTILLNILPGIDVNDIIKSTLTFQIIGILLLLVPVVDCSDAPLLRDDLSDEEKQLCSATAQFDSLVEQLMQKTHAILYSLAHPPTHLNDGHGGRAHSAKARARSTEEVVIERGVLTVYKALGRNCNSQVYDKMLSEFMQLLREHQFVDSRPAMDTVGRITSILISNGMEKAFPLVFSFLAEKLKKLLLSAAGDEVFTEEEVDPTIAWYTKLTADSFRGVHGTILCRHSEQINSLLESLLKFKSKDAFPLIGSFVSNLLSSLSVVSPVTKSYHHLLDQPLEVYLPVRDWARGVDKSKWQLEWHIPSDEEVAYAQQLINRLVVKSWEVLGSVETMKDVEVLKYLTIIRWSMEGASNLSPYFDGEVMSLIPTVTPNVQLYTTAMPPGVKVITAPDGSTNLRRYCYDELERLAGYLLTRRAHDTKSIQELIGLLKVLLHVRGIDGQYFHTQYAGFQQTKRILADPLRGSQYDIESIVEGMVVFLHAQRQLHRPMVGLTATHVQALKLLIRLGLSPYATVRVGAQKVLDASLAWWTYSYKLVLDDILDVIRRPLEAHNHEEFKGAFYMLLNGKGGSIMLRQDWDTLFKVWPCVIRSEHSDKPSIITLFETAQALAEKSFTSFQIKFHFPEEIMDKARELLADYEGNVHKTVWADVDAAGMAEAEQSERELGERNERVYYQLCEELLKLSTAPTTVLHWRHIDVAQSALALMLRRDMPFPDGATLLFFRLLANDVLKTRQMATSLSSSWLKITKPRSTKVVHPVENASTNSGIGAHWPIDYGYRDDNGFLLYNTTQQPTTETAWDGCAFFFKVHHGFYTWPSAFRTYAPPIQQLTANRTAEAMSEVERSVIAMFADAAYMEKLIHYMSLEEKKGHDEFNPINYSLFYRLFRNYSVNILPHFTTHLEKLLKDKREGAQRLATEIVAGLVNGAKLWQWKHYSEMVQWLQPRLFQCLETMTTEAEKNWGTGMATIYGTCEPRQLGWLTEALFQLVQKPSENSFQTTTRFYLLHCAVNQFEWRIPSQWRRLYQLCLPHIGSPHQNLRYRIGGCMASAALCDIQGLPSASGGTQALAKKALSVVTVDEVVAAMNGSEEMQALWKVAMNGIPPTVESVSGGIAALPGGVQPTAAGKRSRLVLTTLLNTLYSLSTQSVMWVNGSIGELIPLLAHFANESQEEELSGSCQSQLIRGYAPAYVLRRDVPHLLDICMAVAEHCSWWKAKTTLLRFLQVFIFANQFDLAEERVRILKIILGLLVDAQFDVRVTAAETLCGLIHCAFIEVDPDLTTTIKAKAASSDPIERHAGTLALAAIIQAFPYTVPGFVPDLLMTLCKHASDPQPIYGTVKKALSEFKRTHQDSWHEHKQEFSEEQLAVLTDLLVSPNYYV